MKICPNCGLSNEYEARFCRGCGKEMVDGYADQVCKKCGKKIIPGMMFCQHCGSMIEYGKESFGYSQESKKDLSQKANDNNKMFIIIAISVIVIMIVIVAGVLLNLKMSKDDTNVGDKNYIESQENEVVSGDVKVGEIYDGVLSLQNESQDDILSGNEIQDYILENSDSEYLTEIDLIGLDAEKCRLARNEIYARHGRIFKDEKIKEYFESCYWYNPIIQPDDFDESMLNDYEIANRDLIVQYESEHGYR